MIVVEYELTATTSAGRRDSAAFVGVLEVREGKMVGWREYQNPVAMGLAMGILPEIVAAYEREPSDAARHVTTQVGHHPRHGTL